MARKVSVKIKVTGGKTKQTVLKRKLMQLRKLKEKHGNSQKNAWAHLIQVGKHASYDSPPNYPYFTGRKISSKDDTQISRKDNGGASASSSD